jgi:alpha-D-xyloside xylohydrolase
MDWLTDEKVWSIADQFMCGQSLLVSPVTKEDEYRRSLYLPHAAAWYDFWTGEKLLAGRRIDVDAPLDRIPLHVRAGTILPLGPEIEYADEKPDGPIELRIYPGANASFDLYEDTGDGYGYEKGEHSIIPILWDEPTQSLTIGKRVGDFPGMVKTREFRVVIVRPGHGNGPKLSQETDEVLQYSGEVLHTLLRVASSSKSN